MGIPTPKCLIKHLEHVIVRQYILHNKVFNALKGCFRIPAHVAGAGQRYCVQVIPIVLHLNLYGLHKALHVIDAILQFVLGKIRPWSAEFIIVKILQLRMLNAHLPRKFVEGHIAMQVAAAQLQTPKHITFQDLPTFDAEYLIRLEIVYSRQKLKFKGEVVHINNDILILL